MTYEKIIYDIRQIVVDHLMLKDFGYGAISDIKVRSEGATENECDYPYLFANPITHQRVGSQMQYQFNVIIMDMVDEESDNFLKIQSECMQYADDVLAKLKLGYKYDIANTITYTPFKERFVDEVAGVTINLTITIPTPLNNCITPFAQPPFVWNLNYNKWINEKRRWNKTPISIGEPEL